MMPNDEDIVIVGIGCKFPGASNLTEYWRVLSKGENHVKEVPKERWNVDAFYDADPDAPGKTYVRKAGFIQGIDEWDHRSYGINDMEAELVDPQQRLVLDCVEMALEDGGITRDMIEKSNTGVYIGSMTDDYKNHVMDDVTTSSTYSVTGTHRSIISARVSYMYNLHGPALTIDTACSSSLVAIDVASNAIKTGSCTTAICGGVNVLLDPQLFIALSKARMLSPTGQCHTFTVRADGYARGEGCGIVILKTFKDALKHGNKIWGTIQTGTNQDGTSAKPITAPAEEQQKKLIRELYKRVGVNTSRVSLIEAHGTGTPLGDPTEVRSLGENFGRLSDAPSDVFIGSVKTNIGHLEAAAGVAGLIKVLLMMKYKTVVPSLWYNKDNENPKLKLSVLGFLVPTECAPWKTPNDKGRIACVNSFGFGGTNAHAIIEQYTNKVEQSQTKDTEEILTYRIVTISAFDRPNLTTNIRVLCEALDKLESIDLDAFSYTSTCRREHRPIRKAVHGRTINDIKLSMKSYLSVPGDSSMQSYANSKHVVFVYCGVGTAWNGMCASLMNLPTFRNAVKQIDTILEPLTKFSIGNIFKHSGDIVSDPFISHLAIFACQVGLTALWKQMGIQPVSVVGQSVGEVAAAQAAGFLSLKDAVNIVYHRSKVLAGVKRGRMAVVRNVDTNLVEKHCKSIGSISIAVFTSDSSCTVSGDDISLQKLREALLTYDHEIIDIDAKCAYHSQFVQGAAKELSMALQMKLNNIEEQTPHISMFSTVTGDKETNVLFNTACYWQENVEKPVAFSKAIKGSSEGTDHALFVEIGPSPVLRGHADRIFPDKERYTVLASMEREDDTRILANTICNLYESGINLNWREISPQVAYIIDLPLYQRRKYKQLYRSSNAVMRLQGVTSQGSKHMYIQHQAPKVDRACFSIAIDETTTPFVYEHMVNGFYIVPGATYADIGFEVGRTTFGLLETDVSISLEFLRPVRVERGVKYTLDASTIKQTDDIMFLLKQDQRTMCKGWVRPITQGKSDNVRSTMDVDQIKVAITCDGFTTLSEDNMYDNMRLMGFQHGPCFRMMKESMTNGIESLTYITVPDGIMKQLCATKIHACILDVMIQTSVNTITENVFESIKEDNMSLLPVAIGELRILQKPEKRMIAYTRRINTIALDTVRQIHFNILLLNSDGKILADLRNYTTYGKRNNSLAPCELRYQFTWQPIIVPTPGNIDEPRILALTNTFNNTTAELFQCIANITLLQPQEENNANLIRKAFTQESQSYDSVILLIHEYVPTSDIDCVAAIELQRLIQNNCMLLADLVKYMTEYRIVVPLYVVTQNTQPNFPTQSLSINLVGEELWGFVRSVQLEFIHGPITLVDVQPTIKESRDTLLKLIANTFKDVKRIKPELLIDTDQVYGGQFTKDRKCILIPSLRAEYKLQKTLNVPYKVMTQRSDGNQLKCLSEDDRHVDEIKSGYIEIQVNSVCSHPITMFPRTTEGLRQDPDAFQESMCNGYILYGLEYTGYPWKLTKTEICRTPKARDGIRRIEKERECVCIWPTEIKTKVVVPKGCVVNLKELGGYYEPGLLLYSVVCWSMVDLVPRWASVVIYSQTTTSFERTLLASMLRVRKHANIIDWTMVSTSVGKKVDVLISLDQIDSSFFVAKYCKEIICLNGAIPVTLMMELIRSNCKPKITSPEISSLLKQKVPRSLPKVVAWLQMYKQRVETVSSHICSAHQLLQNWELKLPVRCSLNGLFKKSGVYIITGGLTGLGWEMVQLFAEMGAGTVVVLCRRHVMSEQLINLNNLGSRTDSKVFCIRTDVTDYASVQSALTEIRSSVKYCDIKGVFHGAGILNSKLLANIKESQVEEVLNPKVIGTINMHIATQNCDLDYFVVASSVNSLIGTPGQCSYGAANSFIDTFIEWRRRRGLPGQSINWGALSVGMASRKQFVDIFEQRGFCLLTKLEIRSCLQEALLCNSTNIVYTNVDWDAAIKDYLNPNMVRMKLQMDVLFEQVKTSVFDADNIEALNVLFDINTLRVAGEKTQRHVLNQVVKTVIGKTIGCDTTRVNMGSTLEETGFDSMSKVTFINLIRTITGYQLTAQSMADSSQTYDDLIQELLKGLFGETGEGGDSMTKS